jgi:hypothetical protein
MDPEFRELRNLTDNRDLENIKAVNDEEPVVSAYYQKNYHYRSKNRVRSVVPRAVDINSLDISDIPVTPKQNSVERKLNTPILVNHKLISHMKNNPVTNIVVAEHSPIGRENTMNKIEELLNKYKIPDKSFDRSISPINRGG